MKSCRPENRTPKMLFALVAAVSLLSGGMFNTLIVDAHGAPVCPFTPQAGRIIVNIPIASASDDSWHGIMSYLGYNSGASFKTDAVSVNIPAGNYDVRIFSADYGIDRASNASQPNERFFLILNNGSSEVVRTNSTDDLPDGNSVSAEKLVNTNLTLSQNINSLIAYHSGYPGDLTSNNSVVPICAAFDLITQTTTITTTAFSAILRIVKRVINDDDGSARASDFNLHVKKSGSEVSGSPASGVASPGRSYTLAAGTYVVSEDDDSEYDTTFSGDCNSSGSVTLSDGDEKTCVVTNDDIEEREVVQRERARRPDREVDVPLIRVTKDPNPPSLVMGGGLVSYVYRVTNPGTVPLSNVNLNDDKCIPVSYISGDTDNDERLDTSETWIYTCYTNLFITTTNTVVAEGSANGLIARDFATATVVVEAIPSFPKTGFPSRGTGNILNVAMLSTALSLPILLYVTAKRKTL